MGVAADTFADVLSACLDGLCKVMKECWSVIILVQCWEMYWRLPMTGCEDVERQLVKILFLKGGSLMHQMYFQQCRTAKKVESIETKQRRMA